MVEIFQRIKAPWLSWLERCPSMTEVASSSLVGGLFFSKAPHLYLLYAPVISVQKQLIWHLFRPLKDSQVPSFQPPINGGHELPSCFLYVHVRYTAPYQWPAVQYSVGGACTYFRADPFDPGIILRKK